MGEAMEFRDLKKQYQVLRKEMDRAVLDAMASGAYIMGPQVKELEKQLAEYVGVKHCITCANGTDAITIAMRAWNVGKGDAVFVPDQLIALFFGLREERFHFVRKPRGGPAGHAGHFTGGEGFFGFLTDSFLNVFF